MGFLADRLVRMISVVLYGRNDSYGYNLHKRAALSLNCIAEVLTDPDDEILFVDYNTPDDYPTFPEAIADTLTEKAKSLLRIFRVRPTVHASYAIKTPLKTLEPIARNIGVRRSSPANRWILSTNTDMIFLARNGLSLSSIAGDLADGYYIAPRIEVPESLWEGFDRKDPVSVIREIELWGKKAHLNEIVKEVKEILYDGPGDFQLIKRSDLFKINGFDERMVLGWHVDFNIAKRLFLLYGQCGDLEPYLWGYHCDHTRQATPFHTLGRKENSIREFVECVTEPVLDGQDHWGCRDESIELIDLLDKSSSALFSSVLSQELNHSSSNVTYTHLDSKEEDFYSCDTIHVFPFLLDSLINAPREWNIAWFGYGMEMFDRFLHAWKVLCFKGSILVDKENTAFFENDLDYKENVLFLGRDKILSEAQAFIVDFSIPEHLVTNGEERSFDSRFVINCLGRALLEIAEHEREKVRDATDSLRRIITINSIHNRFEPFVRSLVGVTLSPFSTRIRQGFVIDHNVWMEGHEENILSKAFIGDAGERQGELVQSLPLRTGYVFYGPTFVLTPGSYELTLRVESSENVKDFPVKPRSCLLEVMKGAELIDCKGIYFDGFSSQEIRINFCEYGLRSDKALSWREDALIDPYEFRLWVDSAPTLTVKTFSLRKNKNSFSLEKQEWLSRLYLGSAEIRRKGKIFAKRISNPVPENYSLVVYGPYQKLTEGRYKLTVGLSLDVLDVSLPLWKKEILQFLRRRNEGAGVRLEVVGPPPETYVFIEKYLLFSDFFRRPLELYFDVQKTQNYPLEFRLWTTGQYLFALKSLMIEKVGSLL